MLKAACCTPHDPDPSDGRPASSAAWTDQRRREYDASTAASAAFMARWLGVPPPPPPTAEAAPKVAATADMPALRALQGLSYAEQHGVPAPLVPWRALRTEHSLAMELAQACGRVDSRVPLNEHGASQWPWVPLVVWLPPTMVRPSATAELRRLVAALVDNVREKRRDDPDGERHLLHEILTTPTAAAAWYATTPAPSPSTVVPASAATAPVPSSSTVVPSSAAATPSPPSSGGMSSLAPAAWVDAWRTIVPSPMLATDVASALEQGPDDWLDRPALLISVYIERHTPYRLSFAPSVDDSWERRRFFARFALAYWKLCVLCNVRDEYMSNGSFVDERLRAMSDAAVTAELTASVVAFDAAADLFQRRCMLSVCYYAHGDEEDFGSCRHGRVCPAYFIGLSPQGHLVGAMTLGTFAENC